MQKPRNNQTVALAVLGENRYENLAGGNSH